MTNDARKPFPKSGRSWPDLESAMQLRTASDADWKGGRTAIFFFMADNESYEIGKRAYMEHFSENALGMTRAYPGLGRMEADVLDYGLELLSAPPSARGVFTTGGTESILVAVKSARDRHRASKPTRAGAPLNIVMPVTGHPAFDKAAILMDVEVRRAPLGRDRRVDTEAASKLIDENTMLLVGSAPCFPHGVIDPISALSKLAEKAGVWLHVDACVGGWIAPFFERIGRGTPIFDFRNTGVRSISADLHKFGFAPKPASTVFFRHAEDIERSTFRLGAWPSGTYTTATISGSRPGAAAAAAWAVINHLGLDGYERAARSLAQLVDDFLAGIAAVEGLTLWARPDVTIVNFGSDEFDIFAVADLMKQRRWVPGLTSAPKGMHTMLSMQHAPALEAYFSDLRDCVAVVRQERSASSLKAVY